MADGRGPSRSQRPSLGGLGMNESTLWELVRGGLCVFVGGVSE